MGTLQRYAINSCSGFPYVQDDYAACHTHQSCGAQAKANVPHPSCTETNIYQTNLEDAPVTSIRDMPKARNADDTSVTPLKKELNTCCRLGEAVCSTNRTGISTRSAKRCLEASLVEAVTGYKYNLHNADAEGETALSKKQTRCSQLEEAVNCYNQTANPVSSKKTVLKASFRKDMAGEDQDQLRDIECDIVIPSKKDQGSRCRPEEAVVDSSYRTSISLRSIKIRLRASVGQDVTQHEHNRSCNIDIEVVTSSNKG